MKKLLLGLLLALSISTSVKAAASPGAFYVANPSGNITYTSTDNMVYDLSTKRVGIGTSNPTSKLSVVGTINATIFVGSGSGLTNVLATTVSSNVVTDNYATAVSINNSLFVSGASNFSGLITGTVSTSNYTSTANFASSATTSNFASSSTTANFLSAYPANVVTNNFATAVSVNSNLYVSGSLTGVTQLSAQTAVLSGIVTASAFVGDGSSLTSISQSNLPPTSVSSNYTGIVTLNSLLVASGGVTTSGTVSANLFVGSGAGLTNIPAGSLPSSVVTNNYQSAVSINARLYVNNTVSANAFVGDGSAITNISQSNLPSTSVSNNYTGSITISGQVTAGSITTNGTVSANSFVGNGSSVTNISQINLPSTSVSSNYANPVSVNSTLYVSSTSTFGGLITGTTTTSNFSTTSSFASTIADGIVTNAELVTGNFTAITGVGTLTTPLSGTDANFSGTVTSNLFAGSGASLTNIPLSAIPSTVVTSNYSLGVSINNFVSTNGLVSNGGVTANYFSGDGSAIANISQSNLPATSVSSNYFNAVTLNSDLFVNGAIRSKAIYSPGVSFNASSRIPSTNSYYSVAFGNGMFVAISYSGSPNSSVIISSDGRDWLPVTGSGQVVWNSIIFGGGKFVAVGTGKVMTSVNGRDWAVNSGDGSGKDYYDVAYGNGVYAAVAVGNVSAAGVVMTSPDGETWTSRTGVFNENWTSITYGQNKFVAIAYEGFSTNGTIMTSEDGGITWVSQNATVIGKWYAVDYLNNTFVATQFDATPNETIMTSTDGSTWTARTAPNSASWVALAYGNGIYLAGASDPSEPDDFNLMASTDTITWYPVANPAPSASIIGLAFGNGIFVGVPWEGDNLAIYSGVADQTLPQNNNIYQGGLQIYGTVTTNSVLVASAGVTTSRTVSANRLYAITSLLVSTPSFTLAPISAKGGLNTHSGNGVAYLENTDTITSNAVLGVFSGTSAKSMISLANGSHAYLVGQDRTTNSPIFKIDRVSGTAIAFNAIPNFTILENDNVGVSVATPSYKLEVAGIVSANNFTTSGTVTANYLSALTVSANSINLAAVSINGTVTANNFYSNRGITVNGTVSANSFTTSGTVTANTITVGTASSVGTLRFATFNQPNVLQLIGNTATSQNLCIVNGYGSNGGSGVMVGTTRADGTAFQVQNNVTVSGGVISGPGTTIFTVRGDGNVGIGVVSPNQKMEVLGGVSVSATVTANKLYAQNVTVNALITYANSGSSTGTTLVVDAAGVIRQLTSSERFKENVRENSMDLSKIHDLVVHEFNYKATSEVNGTPVSNSTKNQIGLIAEEAVLVDPELVNLDSEGLPYSIDTNRLLYMILCEVQRLKRENAELRLLISPL